MTFATFALTIAVFVNLFIFLAAYPAGAGNAPMLSLMQSIATGRDVGQSITEIFTSARLLSILAAGGAIIGLMLLVSTAISPATALTGSYATFHAVTVIAIGIFVVLFALPDFSAFGIPEPINMIVNVFFGFMIAMAIFGLWRGE